MERARNDIIKRIFESSEAMKRGMYAHMQSYFQHLPITRSQLEILSAIKHLQPVSSKQLAQQLFLTPGAVSQLVESLDHDGFLKREADPSDRRIQYLRVSDNGQKLLHDIEQNRRDILEEVLKDLTLEELTVWLKIQTKLTDHKQAAQFKNHKTNTKEAA